MNWFYVINGQQAGPASDAQLNELLRSGRITKDYVWLKGVNKEFLDQLPEWMGL